MLFLKIVKQYPNITSYTFDEDYENPGQCVIIIMSNGMQFKNKLLDLIVQHPVFAIQQQEPLSYVYKQIERNFIEAKTELLSAKLETQKLFTDIAADQKFGSMHIRGDVNICFFFV